MVRFGRCDEPSCNGKDVRLFECIHHCNKMVCLQHLIEHDRLIDNDRQQLNALQQELKYLYTVYSSLIDENKIRLEYQQKLDDYKKLMQDVNHLLSGNQNDIEKFRVVTGKLKEKINEKQNQPDQCLTIVKVEPVEESLPSITNSEDECVYIGYDRLQNLVIDTNYNRSNALEDMDDEKQLQSENGMIVATDDEDDHDEYNLNTSVQVHRIAGECPLWLNGAYGLTKEHHFLRLCTKKHFADLRSHMRYYHGFFASIAGIIARAVYSKIPVTKRLIPNDVLVTDPRRCFFCPLRNHCNNDAWLSASALKNHLIQEHQMLSELAEAKIRRIIWLNKSKPMSKTRSRIVEVIKRIKSRSKK